MKKLTTIVVLFLVSITLIGCGPKTSKENEINVGVSFFPMKELLLLIEEDLKDEGYTLKIHEFSDYQTPNNLVDNKELDANMIQHHYFLESYNKANDADLEVILPIYHAIFALYSKDYASIDAIPNGANITLPDDATNKSRALYLLSQAGLLTFKGNKTVGLTVEDIESNPKNLTFNDPVPLTSLAQRYTETGLAIMYPTYARSLELVGDEQRIYEEKLDSVTEGYAISLVSRSDNKDSEKVKVLIKHVTSDKVRQFLIDNYSWASSPAF